MLGDKEGIGGAMVSGADIRREEALKSNSGQMVTPPSTKLTTPCDH